MSTRDIADRLATVRNRIEHAARRAGRDSASVRLLAVSKTKPAEDVAAAYRAGQRAFGESYAQELVEKHAALSRLAQFAGEFVEIEWHFIGRLQTNKAKFVAPITAMVHAVDDARLAVELAKRAEKRAGPIGMLPLGVLVEVNLGGEASKGGVGTGDLEELLRTIESLPTLRLRGLMTIPPPTPTTEASRPFHRALRALRDAHGGDERLPELSTGMTDDLEVAIEEGATIVRVGTAIFGARTPASAKK